MLHRMEGMMDEIREDWIRRAKECRELDQMLALAESIKGSSHATQSELSAARAAVNAINEAGKRNAQQNQVLFARNRFGSLRLAIGEHLQPD